MEILNTDSEHENKDNYTLSDEHIKILVKRKTDFLAGKTTSKPWSELKKTYKVLKTS